MARPKNIDQILRDWPYEFGEVSARLIRGSDRRKLIQMRIDMGVLQMEVEGRPDGEQPVGFETYYDYLMSLAFAEGADFTLTEERCLEVDREFVQFYHRRICWLALREFELAVADANHTIALMDFSTAHSPDDEWTALHERYRPFVLFHRTQAAALAELDESGPEGAIAELDEGIRSLRSIYEHFEPEEEFEEDELLQKLGEMKSSLADHYQVGPSLSQQLTDAIAAEQYERAAELRDQLAKRKQERRTSKSTPPRHP